MNVRTRSTVAVITVLACVIVISALFLQSDVQAWNRDPRSLAGAWEVEVSPDGGVPLVNFSANTKDGLIINTNELGFASVGEWKSLGDRRFAVKFTGFQDIGEGSVIRYVVQATVDLGYDKQSYAGPSVTDVYDAEGNLLFSMNGTVSGTRMYAEVVPFE